ncbi:MULTISPECIES: hypothetical protein [Bradyrhizobium]|nr:hypothetical protein [Bradyrhizobium elkanii]
MIDLPRESYSNGESGTSDLMPPTAVTVRAAAAGYGHRDDTLALSSA